MLRWLHRAGSTGWPACQVYSIIILRPSHSHAFVVAHRPPLALHHHPCPMLILLCRASAVVVRAEGPSGAAVATDRRALMISAMALGGLLSSPAAALARE